MARRNRRKPRPDPIVYDAPPNPAKLRRVTPALPAATPKVKAKKGKR
ncbi:MAG: hypothetical protein ACRDTV_23775 [Mycobacterium sp.]